MTGVPRRKVTSACTHVSGMKIESWVKEVAGRRGVEARPEVCKNKRGLELGWANGAFQGAVGKSIRCACREGKTLNI